MHLPLSAEEFDSLFHEVSNRLTSHGSKLSEKELLAILHRVMDGVGYLNRRYAMWWTTLLPNDQVDVSKSLQTPYNLVLLRFGLEITGSAILPYTVAMHQGFLPLHPADNDEKDALNAFWNEVLSAIKADEAHKLA